MNVLTRLRNCSSSESVYGSGVGDIDSTSGRHARRQPSVPRLARRIRKTGRMEDEPMFEAKIVCSACRTRLLGSDHSSEGEISRCPRCGAQIGVGVRGSNPLKSGSARSSPSPWSLGVVVGWAVAILVPLGLGSLARDRGHGSGERPPPLSSRRRSPPPARRPRETSGIARRGHTPSSPGPAGSRVVPPRVDAGRLQEPRRRRARPRLQRLVVRRLPQPGGRRGRRSQRQERRYPLD